MRNLILIKHSQPNIVAEVPAKQWRLSEEGRRRCVTLAHAVARYDPAHIVASVEPKATETAALIAHEIGVSCSTVDGLDEHDRSNEPFHTAHHFQEAVANFFAHPDELIFGNETATQAQTRFIRAVERVLAEHATGNIAIVAHGTVITLFVAAYNQIEPLVFWRQLGLPSFVVLTLPAYRLQTVVSDRAHI